MCTKWLWSYPVDVAVAVAQYSDKTYFFQTPTSSIPVFEKRWKEKNAKLWFSAKCEGKILWESTGSPNCAIWTLKWRHFLPKLPKKKNWQPNFRRGKVYFHILGLFLAFWDLKWSSNATLFFKWYRRQMINSIAYFRKLVLHDFAYVN